MLKQVRFPNIVDKLLSNKQREQNLICSLFFLRSYIADAYIDCMIRVGYWNIVVSIQQFLLGSFRKKQDRILSKDNTDYPYKQKLKDIDHAMP